MANPVIVAVDDDPQVLRAVERDLRRRFGHDYRVVAAESGPSALDAVKRLKLRGSAVALFLADQRMPGMTGTELLVELRHIIGTTASDEQSVRVDANISVGEERVEVKNVQGLRNLERALKFEASRQPSVTPSSSNHRVSDSSRSLRVSESSGGASFQRRTASCSAARSSSRRCSPCRGSGG